MVQLTLIPATGRGSKSPPARFSLKLGYLQISHGMIFGDIVADPLASQKLLSSCQYLLPFSGGMTGCRDEGLEICRFREHSNFTISKREITYELQLFMHIVNGFCQEQLVSLLDIARCRPTTEIQNGGL